MSYADDLLRFEPWPYKPGGIPDPCRVRFYMEAAREYGTVKEQLELLEDEGNAEVEKLEEEVGDLQNAIEEARDKLKRFASELEDDASLEDNAEELRDQIGQAVAKIEAIAKALGEALK